MIQHLWLTDTAFSQFSDYLSVLYLGSLYSMDQSLSLQPSGDLHLSSYEDTQHSTLPFGQNGHFVPHSVTSNIESLLPISSDPQTESSISQITQMHGQLPISDSGDVFIENRSCENQKKKKIPSRSQPQKPQKRQHHEPKPASSLAKKRGRPRDAEPPLSGVPEDVRWILRNLHQPLMCINPTTDFCNSAVVYRLA